MRRRIRPSARLSYGERFDRVYARKRVRTAKRFDANGKPITANLTGANRHDVTQLIPLVEAIVPIVAYVGGL